MSTDKKLRGMVSNYNPDDLVVFRKDYPKRMCQDCKHEVTRRVVRLAVKEYLE